MAELEYIIVVKDSTVWETSLWDELTKDGLGDDFIPTRGVTVINDRPFNTKLAHFSLTAEEAAEIAKDDRIESIELNPELNDEIEFIGDRYYVKAEATFNCDGESFGVNAYAREPEIKKGMDSAQITGATSSYARKYALNGLFAIDDCKDADTNEARRQGQAETKPEVAKPKPVAKKQAPKEVQPADIDPETGEAYTDTYTENHVDMFNTVADFCNEHCTKHHMKPGDLKNWIKGQYNGRSLGDMKGDDALLLEVMSRIQKECSSDLRNEPVQDGF